MFRTPQFFLHTWFRNVLRATTACTFSTSQLPKVVRDRQFLTLLTSKCASRHNGMHFFDISTSKSAPKLRCFVHFDFEMCFVPQRRAVFHLSSGQMAPDKAYFSTRRSRKSLEKPQWIATFLPFRAPASLSFSSLIFSLLLFSSLTLPTSAFPSVHIDGSLTSKLPSVIYGLDRCYAVDTRTHKL